MTSSSQFEINQELTHRLEMNGPHYTFYSPEDRFIKTNEEFQDSWVNTLKRSNQAITVYISSPIHQALTQNDKGIKSEAAEFDNYLNYIEKEISIRNQLVGKRLPIIQLHLSGVPSLIPATSDLLNTLEEQFVFRENCRRSIKINPQTVSNDAINFLTEVGFNHFSIQVGDKLLENEKGRLITVVDLLRQYGAKSVNIELIYGAPGQTIESMKYSLKILIDLKPDCLFICNYAWTNSKQDINLADDHDDSSMLLLILEELSKAGYLYIGLDKFTKVKASLYQSARDYMTYASSDLIGLGVGAVSRIGAIYTQNEKMLSNYYAALDTGKVPIAGGLRLSMDDLVRRAVIQSLAHLFMISFEAIEVAYFIKFKNYFSHEVDDLKQFEELGLITIDDQWLTVTDKGKFFVRNICMIFDKYYAHNPLKLAV